MDHLKQNGFEDVYCPRLPSATEILPLPATANLEGDTAAIHSAIESLVVSGGDVIALMHSYGGVVGTNALDGLLAPQRNALSLEGGVVHIVYMAACVQPAGSRHVDSFNGQMPYVNLWTEVLSSQRPPREQRDQSLSLLVIHVMSEAHADLSAFNSGHGRTKTWRITFCACKILGMPSTST